MKKNFIALFLCVSIIACKSDKKETIEQNKVTIKETTEESTDYLEIKINAVIPKDDEFSVQYKDEDNKWYPKGGINVAVVGSDVAQDLVFNLPKEKYPFGLLFVVGKNNKQNVIINSLSFKQNDDEFVVPKEKVFQFLNPNEYIKFNKGDNSYEIEGDDNKRAFFNSRGILIKRLEANIY
ncbi:hypothetical protein [Olleya namhaensis]|uniref:Lipoprotein n=1 Tax=Olleya namhaensis TaxID=1144750 RepID=A0A1I3JNL1_9FLAO|nr:hypothetical protein [Olleya namhaensis]SFI61862.1 hypothetical protein SAMN05443431_101485 [Olleya namhaensis]